MNNYIDFLAIILPKQMNLEEKYVAHNHYGPSAFASVKISTFFKLMLRLYMDL